MVKNNKEYHIKINGKSYKWDAPEISGAEIRQIDQIPSDYQIFLKVNNREDLLVRDEDKMNLTDSGVEQFYSKKQEGHHKYRIIVNGREKEWGDKSITYDQVVKLAFENYIETSDMIYTVDYTDGPHQNPSGSMVKGDVRFITNNMVFNVTATNRS
jgi:hypothetical protein